MSPIVDTKKSPLPPLLDLAEIVEALLTVGLKLDKEPRREIKKIMQSKGTIRQWFHEPRGPYNRDTRINSHLGADGELTPGRVHDPEEVKTVVVSFKTSTTGAILVVQRQTYKIVYFRDRDNGRLRVDTIATVGAKQDMRKQGRRFILIYKAPMYTEASLDPDRCTHKAYEKARRN